MIEIKIIKHGSKYKIKHYPESSKLAKILNKQSDDFVFTLSGADKVKRSLETKYGKNN